MEERYINSPRGGGRRTAPAPSRRRTPPPPQKKPLGTRLLWGFYKIAVVLSALVVAVWLGMRFLIHPPEQNQLPPPSQAGTVTPWVGGTADPGGAGGGTGLERQKGVYTIFLAATDVEGYRTDVMMVARYDTVNQTVGVVSVPRDTLVARSKGNPHLVYGSGGLEDRIGEVSNMLGIPIDYYIKVNIKGFVTLVDYLDGIDFYVPCNMDYDDPEQNLHIHFKEGQQHLNGQQTMEVSRFRKNNPDPNGNSTGYSDTGRTETQQKLLLTLAKKVLSWGSLTKINGFVEIFNQNVSTDLSLNDMLYFASQAVNVDLSTGVETTTLPGRGDAVYRGYRWCYELEPEGTLDTVNRLINPYDQPLTLADMNLAKGDK